MKSKEQIVEQLRIEKARILQDFDFAKTAAMFRVLGHSYSGGGYPAEETLLSIAASLMDSAIREYQKTGKPTRVSSGMLIAFVHEWNSSVELELVYNPLGLSKAVWKD